MADRPDFQPDSDFLIRDGVMDWSLAVSLGTRLSDDGLGPRLECVQ